MKQNTLIFEGAGWHDCDSSKATDLLNCRIRTRIKNNDGRVIYLELTSMLTDKKTHEIYKQYKIVTFINHCFYSDVDWDKRSNYSKELAQYQNKYNFEYDKENLLKFVNEKLNCSFTDIKTINDGSVRVHDTELALSDCSNPNAKQFVDIPILYETIKDIKPLHEYKNYDNIKKYQINWEDIKNLSFVKKDYIKKENDIYYITIRHYEGKITSAEIGSNNNNCPCISLGKETARELISKLK